MVTVDTTKLIPLHSGQFFGFVQELCGAGVVVFVSLYTGDRPAGLLGSQWNAVERLWSEAIPTTLHPLSHYAESQPRLGWTSVCLRSRVCVCSCTC